MQVYDESNSPSKLFYNDDLEVHRHKEYIFHLGYELTEAPSAPFRLVSALSLVTEFDKPGPVKMYDRWLAKLMCPSPEDNTAVQSLVMDYQNDRKSLFRWQKSDRGLLLLDGKLTEARAPGGQITMFYLYEFPFLAYIKKAWNRCHMGMFKSQIKEAIKEEFDLFYPERGLLMESTEKREQSLDEKLARAASMIAGLIDDYEREHGKLGPAGVLSLMAGDMNERLEQKGKPGVFIDPYKP